MPFGAGLNTVRRSLAAAAFLGGALALQGCGFQPLYAAGEAGDAPGLRSINFVGVETSEQMTPVLTRAFERRVAEDTLEAEYDLAVTVREATQRLAVQIDNSVTRYNYRLRASYTLTRRADNKEFRGSAESVASFNVVSSQYSTLYAEEAAREKAANVLVREVERSILLKLAPERDAAASVRRRSAER